MTMFTSLRDANVARQAEWPGADKVDLAFRGVELAGEVGEACNVIKKLERMRRGIKGKHSTPEALAEELADVVICCDLIAMDVGINLRTALADKFNKTSFENGLTTRLSEGGL